MAFLHGVETIEVQSASGPVREVRTAVIGLVGTAPVHLVDAANRTVDEIVVDSNDRDDAKYFGPETAGYTIPTALKRLRQMKAGLVVVVNVFDPAVHKTAVVDEAQTFVDDKLSLDNAPIVDPVVVTSSDGVTTYAAGTDYTVDYTKGIITRVAAGAIAAGATVKVDYNKPDPSLVTASDIIGTTDASGNRTGMQAWLDTRSKRGFNPKILIAPNYHTQAAVAGELRTLSGKLRAINAIDAAVGTTFSQVLAKRGTAGDAFNTSDKRTVLCFPHVKVFSKITNATALEALSTFVAGIIAWKDRELGYWWSPSNTEINGLEGLEIALTAAINDRDSEANQLNEQGILTLFNDYGTGIRTWGNRSAAFPTESRSFIHSVRVGDVIHESIEYYMLKHMDKPVTQAVLDEVTENVNDFMRSLQGKGAIIDGKCWLAADNTADSLSLGQAIWEYDWIDPPSLETMTFRSAVNIDYLAQLVGGAA